MNLEQTLEHLKKCEKSQREAGNYTCAERYSIEAEIYAHKIGIRKLQDRLRDLEEDSS